MSGELLQDAVVTLVALAAIAVVLRRVLRTAGPDAAPKCANCPSGDGGCAPAPLGRLQAEPQAHPLVVIRAPRR